MKVDSWDMGRHMALSLVGKGELRGALQGTGVGVHRPHRRMQLTSLCSLPPRGSLVQKAVALHLLPLSQRWETLLPALLPAQSLPRPPGPQPPRVIKPRPHSIS